MSAIDVGLLSPVTAGNDRLVGDEVFLDALVRVECALVSAYAEIGVAPDEASVAVAHAFGLDDAAGRPAAVIDLEGVVAASVAGGNPVIPLVALLRQQVPVEHRAWVHRGATSQDIWDTAIMQVARDAVAQVRLSLTQTSERLVHLAETHRDDVVAARTLTQHAVPTTMGLRAAGWARSLDRAIVRLDALDFPAQLAGAGGTLASFVEITGSTDAAHSLVAQFATQTQLSVPDAPWHVARWPITELGDALTGTLDALGKFAGDVATLSRTEIGEVAEGVGGGSSAMPQKQNPAEAVLIRSAALRAPQLAATLHLASALAVDERPDGAWHAEWPTLRELLRLALGASSHAASLAANLRVNTDAAAVNLARTNGLIVAERLSLVLGPLVGKDAVAAIIAEVGAGGDAAACVRAALAGAGAGAAGADAVGVDCAGIDVDALIDPANYTGLAGLIVDAARDAVVPAASRVQRREGGGQ